MKLTDNQNLAVKSVNGNVLVHAGSGAGKTASFTARIANLIKHEKVAPSQILGLTFTKEAAENMRTRLAKIIGKNKASEVNLLTFHSFAYRTLKKNYPNIYDGKTIMKEWWKLSKMYDIVAPSSASNNIGLNLTCKGGDLNSFISFQKSNMVREGKDIIMTEDFESYGSKKQLIEAFDTYVELVKNARLMDFDDMISDMYYKLLEDSKLLNQIKKEYQFVMVDEFQDTNTINLEILKMITDNNLFVVGDFRQGIYGFINANVDNILDFQKDFEDVELIELQDNFRSTRNIVAFSNEIIAKSPNDKYKQFDKQVAAREDIGSPILVHTYTSEYMETEAIIKRIMELIDKGMVYSDFAILFRTNAQLGIYEMELADKDIPVNVSDGRSFFKRKEIDDILSYAEHAVDSSDDMSIRKIVNTPNRFISKAIVNNLDKHAYTNKTTFEVACGSMNAGYANNNLRGLKYMFEGFRKDIDTMNAGKFLQMIYNKTHYEAHIQKTAATTSDLSLKVESLERLFEMAKKFSNIANFLGHVSVAKNNNKKDEDGVKLMTVHASKGLEFPYVFIPSVSEDNFPHQMNPDIEEERRLFYVASSRAKDNMEISYPVFNNDSDTNMPSPFLADVMGEDVLKQIKSKVMGSNEPDTTSFSELIESTL